MYRMSFALAALALLATQPVVARDLAPGCNPAIQNWVNGSKDTCPPMGGSAVGGQPPVFITPPVEEYCHPKVYYKERTFSRRLKRQEV